MSFMQPTTRLRWNEDPGNKCRCLEQLWVETTAAHDTALSRGYVISEPKKEWRPIDTVKISALICPNRPDMLV